MPWWSPTSARRRPPSKPPPRSSAPTRCWRRSFWAFVRARSGRRPHDLSLVRGADSAACGKQGDGTSHPPGLCGLPAALSQAPPACAQDRDGGGAAVPPLPVRHRRHGDAALAFHPFDLRRVAPRVQRRRTCAGAGGVFADSLGLFEGMADRERVAILLDLLGRKVRILLDEGAITAA